MQTLTLAEFLLARIAEDEAVARKGTPGRWKLGGLDPEELGDAWFLRSADREHLWRWYPERVLAECEAKRRIVERHRRITRPGWGLILPDQCGECGGNSGIVGWPCPTLRVLALPYADHKDYREEWRP